MKINPKFQLHTVVGEHLLLLQGKSGGDMTRVMAFNESSLLLWNTLHDKDFSLEEVVKVLLDNYEVTEVTATSDAQRWVDTLRDNGVILTE